MYESLGIIRFPTSDVVHFDLSFRFLLKQELFITPDWVRGHETGQGRQTLPRP